MRVGRPGAGERSGAGEGLDGGKEVWGLGAVAARAVSRAEKGVARHGPGESEVGGRVRRPRVSRDADGGATKALGGDCVGCGVRGTTVFF